MYGFFTLFDSSDVHTRFHKGEDFEECAFVSIRNLLRLSVVDWVEKIAVVVLKRNVLY